MSESTLKVWQIDLNLLRTVPNGARGVGRINDLFETHPEHFSEVDPSAVTSRPRSELPEYSTKFSVRRSRLLGRLVMISQVSRSLSGRVRVDRPFTRARIELWCRPYESVLNLTVGVVNSRLGYIIPKEAFDHWPDFCRANVGYRELTFSVLNDFAKPFAEARAEESNPTKLNRTARRILNEECVPKVIQYLHEQRGMLVVICDKLLDQARTQKLADTRKLVSLRAVLDDL